jgi:Putative cyclase
MKRIILYLAVTAAILLFLAGSHTYSEQTTTTSAGSTTTVNNGLWKVYEQWLKNAKYVDLTHTISPSIPVWKGFGSSTFGPTLNPATGKPYQYAKDGFEATHYDLSTDQLGTQLDPPAH